MSNPFRGVRGFGADSQYLAGRGQMAYEWRRSRTLPNGSGKARLGPRHVAIMSSQFLSLYAAQKVASRQVAGSVYPRHSSASQRLSCAALQDIATRDAGETKIDFRDAVDVQWNAADDVQDLILLVHADAVGVARLKDTGAVIIGKTNMHELGRGTTSLVSYYRPVYNPWNRDYIAGGSSGGSAAAVACGMCYATLDTDAIGSCRLPASCCAVVGFKGTYGLGGCYG